MEPEVTTDNEFEMTDEQIKLARAAGRLATKHLSAVKLYESLQIGESLLVGRAAAMKAARVNTPFGRPYVEAFGRWKKLYRFPDGKEAANFFDQCIVCAENRDLANSIIAGLGVKDKARLGVWGLAKRIRDRLREEVEGPPAPRKLREENAELVRSQQETAKARADVIKLRANPFPFWTGSAAEASRSIFEDRGDGRRPDGKGRELILALARDFKGRFPSSCAALIDELLLILKGGAS
jgi:hypothetical protein